MILFIFEGAKSEPHLYNGVKKLFFPNGDNQVICSFCSSIYTFYKRLKDNFGEFADVVDVLKTELKRTNPDSELFNYKSSDFESIYLFFDYDFYIGDLCIKNKQMQELLEYFCEETDKGKLYISYPMIESIQYTKKLPDIEFGKYVIKRKDSCSKQFKSIARQYCYYKGYAFLKNADNWRHLILQHVSKANQLTKNIQTWPEKKEDVTQLAIFDSQLLKHVLPQDEVAILNAFPLFLYDYFPQKRFVQEGN